MPAMLNKILILIDCCLIFSISSHGQSSQRDPLWRRLIFINDSLKSSPADELKLLTKIEAETKQGPNRNDSTHAFLLTQIGTLHSKQVDFLKAVQYYRQAIHMIRSNVNSPLVNPAALLLVFLIITR